ncbi:MAG TPA: type II secretion system protein N [Deltaproteobacteria bacterium]|jgi:general secretion pathway protein C|nr:type II secretion system protein N [Deltaproteobacteria bacterium]HOI07605.1 type II secretion system protein N [Deltaproteobacteria bacterium]
MTKRLTWLIQLSVLTLFAWVIAGIITTVGGHLLYSVPEPREQAPRPAAAGKETVQTRDAYNVIYERDLLKVARAGASSGFSGLDKDAVRPIAEMGLKLKGTIAGPDEIARAIIENGTLQKMYKIGDEIMGAKLLAIFRNKVIMNVGGQEQMLIIEETASGQSPAVAAAPRVPRPGGAFPQAGSLPPASPMRNLDEFLGKARVVPYFKGGEPYGFRVSNLSAETPAYGMGVRTGDIIRSVNGIPVRTPEDAFKAYSQFQNESSVQLDIERNGQSTTVTMPIKR